MKDGMNTGGHNILYLTRLVMLRKLLQQASKQILHHVQINWLAVYFTQRQSTR
jgi:hypothetical protein